MEALVLPDQSISTYSRSRNRYNGINSFSFSGSGHDLNPINILSNINGSHFGLSPSLSPSSFASFRSVQPPLLPLPPAKYASPSRKGSFTSHHQKINKIKEQNFAPKKAKSKRDSSRCYVKSPINRLGPDPADFPKEVPKGILRSSSLQIAPSLNRSEYPMSIFPLAPPPSSLPLPKFSLRPKTQCNAEAGRVDPGATDNLRRLLHLS